MALDPPTSRDSGSGGAVVIFDSTLGAAAASIDSGVGSIPADYDVLEVWMILRTNDAGTSVLVDVTVNNDTGNNYDQEAVVGFNATVTGSAAVAQAKWTVNAHGAGGGASYASCVRITLPGYAQTSFFKVAEALIASNDSTANENAVKAMALTWRSTAAITRMKVAAQGAATLDAGSRLLIYGR